MSEMIHRYGEHIFIISITSYSNLVRYMLVFLFAQVRETKNIQNLPELIAPINCNPTRQ